DSTANEGPLRLSDVLSRSEIGQSPNRSRTGWSRTAGGSRRLERSERTHCRSTKDPRRTSGQEDLPPGGGARGCERERVAHGPERRHLTGRSGTRFTGSPDPPGRTRRAVGIAGSAADQPPAQGFHHHRGGGDEQL